MAPNMGPFFLVKRRSTTLRFANDDRSVRHPLPYGDLTAVAATLGAIAAPAFASIAPNVPIAVSSDADRHAAFTDRNADAFGDCRSGGQQYSRCGETHQ